jgi:alkylhydroperoxidase family enzyme
MTARMDVAALAPAAYKAMLNLDRAAHQGPLAKPLMELDSHSFDAREVGVADERLFAVAVWQEAPFFSDEERAALALTEAMTRLSEGGDRVPDEVWAQAGKHFDEKALAALVMLITTINAWNRIGVSTRMVPRSYVK